MNTIKFTVVIPLYNKAKHILRTLESVNKQKYPAAEIIIIDDGSTDEGPAIVEQANFANVKLIKQKNQGVSAARNHGVAAASNEHIAFLDADDQWLPLFLAEVVHLITKYPNAKFFGTRYQIVEGEGNYIDAKIKINNPDPDGVLLDNYFEVASQGDLPFSMSSMVMTRSLFNTIGGFPLNEPIGEDQDLFCRAALNSPIAYSPNIHSLYHKDAQNQAHKINVPDKECAFSVRVTQAAFNQNKDKQKQMLKYSAAHLCHLAKLNLMNGQYAKARALLSDPRCKLKLKHFFGLYTYSCMLSAKEWMNNISAVK